MKNTTFNAMNFLREQLIDLALRKHSKELFLNLTSDNWEEHIISYSNKYENCEEMKELDFREETLYNELHEKGIKEFDDYLKETLVTETEADKTIIMKELLELDELVSDEFMYLLNQVYTDKQLFKLMNFVLEDVGRNGVFINYSKNEVLLKENFPSDDFGNIETALRFYKKHNIPFFISMDIMREKVEK